MLTGLGVARYGRRQLWVSAGLGIAHLKGVTRYPESVRWARWCHPPIPTGREDRGGGNITRGLSTHALVKYPCMGCRTWRSTPPLENRWDRYDPGEGHVPGVLYVHGARGRLKYSQGE